MNKKKSLLISMLLLSFAVTSFSKGIIPQPLHIIEREGVFSFGKEIHVYANEANMSEVSYLSKLFEEEFGLKAVSVTSAKTKGLTLTVNSALKDRQGAEGYTLTVDGNGIKIEAASRTGVFYGIQSLRQLLTKKGDVWQVAFVDIEDNPRFSWRSYMLDEGRYFKGKETVKKLLDEMALLKMNVFHWHLTEDQGWRLAIEKYPALTAIGSKRDSTQIGNWESKVYDGIPHEGYYTKEDVREIISYATERHIKVVPEIEMPGHSSAAIAAYPWLGVTKQPIKVPTSFGVKYDVFDVTDPKVIGFLQDVLNEVIQLFPSDVVHIGGDEVKYQQWLQNEKVQAYMKEHKLPSPADLQIAFTNDISNYLEKKQKRMMGWNDIMGAQLHEFNKDAAPVTGSLASSTIVQFWKGELDMVKDAVSKGYDVVNSYHVFTYLDYDYNSIPLKKAYDFDPIPAGLDVKYHDKILGLGCQMWGEWIPTIESMYKMTFPRIAAYAEVGWTTKENKNFDRFNEKMENLYIRWDQEKISYNKK
jgi:hexosaminidase